MGTMTMAMVLADGLVGLNRRSRLMAPADD
jgi:hypothetical protein